MAGPLKSFAAFWPYYVGQHQSPVCRGLHYLGSTLALLNVAGLVATGQPAFVLAALVSGYGPAWVGHFFVEHNRPATFTYPRWSLMGDFKMYGLFLTGRMGAEVERLRAGGFGTAAAHSPHTSQT
jgi:hypothetical protein